MTISTTGFRKSFSGNGVTTAFATDFAFLDETELVVTLVSSAGVETVKTITTHYTVSGGDGATGTVTMLTAPASGETLVIERDTTKTQTIDLQDNDPFPPDTIEGGFDRAMLVAQEIAGLIGRALRQPDGDVADIGRLPIKADRLGKFLYFNATTGDPEAAAGTTEVPVSAFMETLLDDASAAAARTTLGAAATSDLAGYQPLDADLTAIAALAQTRGRVAMSNGTTWVAHDGPLLDNLLYNGALDVWQEGTTFDATTTPANNDDTYIAEGCILLSDGNDIADITKETTTVPTGFLAAIKADVETANKKFGFLFPIEQKDAARVLGGTASAAFQARKGASNATLDKLRAALIAWDGTADTITSDVVSAWGAEGADPTLVANWTYESTPADLTLTDSYQEFRVENASIDTASAKNLALFVWVDNADATVADLLYLADFRLVEGAIAAQTKKLPYSEVLAICQRYYEKTFEDATRPAQNVGSLLGTLVSVATASTGPVCTWQFRTRKRVDPTITTYNPYAANDDWRDTSNTATVNSSIIASTGVNAATIGAGAAAAGVANYHIHATANARL